jgi:hypothetical protein
LKTHPFVLNTITGADSQPSEDEATIAASSITPTKWPYLLATKARGSGAIELVSGYRTKPLSGRLCILMSASRTMGGWKERTILLGM